MRDVAVVGGVGARHPGGEEEGKGEEAHEGVVSGGSGGVLPGFVRDVDSVVRGLLGGISQHPVIIQAIADHSEGHSVRDRVPRKHAIVLVQEGQRGMDIGKAVVVFEIDQETAVVRPSEDRREPALAKEPDNVVVGCQDKQRKKDLAFARHCNKQEPKDEVPGEFQARGPPQEGDQAAHAHHHE